MGRRVLRVVGGLVVATMAAALLVACAPGPAEGSGSIEVRAGQDARLTAGEADALVIEIPGSSLTGAGTLTAEPVEGPDGISGWSIDLSGTAELTGPATLRFAHDFAEGEPAPIVTSTADGTAYEVAEKVDVEADGIVVETTHFSNWFTLWWDDVLTNARAGLDRIYGDTGAPPTCESEDSVRDAGYSITSDSGNRVYWCLGRSGGDSPALKVVNGRGYTVAAEHTAGITVTDAGSTDLIGVISNIFKEAPSRAGNTVTLVGPGSAIEYGVEGSGRMGVRVKPSVGGFLVTAAQYAVDTLAMVLPYAGRSGMSKVDVAKLFNWESCLSGYSSMVTGEIETATQASAYFSDAVGATLGCMDEALAAAGLAFWGTAVASGLSWLISGVRTALNGFGAAADTALNPSGYSIYITAPTPALPGLPTELSGRWCTRTGDEECFEASEIMERFPDAHVDGDPYVDGSIPGSTGFSICLYTEFDDGGCTTASTIYLRYLPAGVEWDCRLIEVQGAGWPDCEPDYTADHDSSEPRLVVLPNHQQDVVYHDAPPMYRVGG